MTYQYDPNGDLSSAVQTSTPSNNGVYAYANDGKLDGSKNLALAAIF